MGSSEALFLLLYCRRCSAHSSITPWSWSLCWNNCHVCNLPYGHGSWQADCTGTDCLLEDDFLFGMSWVLFAKFWSSFLHCNCIRMTSYSLCVTFSDREVSLSVQRNVPCFINCAPGGRPTGFVQGLASFCHWSGKSYSSCNYTGSD